MSKNGVIDVVCAFTMMSINQWKDETVKELALIEDENDPILKMLMIVTRSKGKTAFETLLQIREFPKFELLYELKVTPYCKLFDASIDQETPLFIEGSYDVEDEENQDINAPPINNCVQMLRIRGICEGNPESRLMRLLAKKKFEEAEM